MYDNDSAASRQFQKVTVTQRLGNYWGIDDWEFSMSWILCTKNTDEILKDWGIDMTITLVRNNINETGTATSLRFLS